MSLELELKRKVQLVQTEKTTWHMIFLPKGLSNGLREFFAGMESGFGSLPVQVTIGKTSWKTSIFSKNKNGEYLLLLNVHVRKKENIKAGDSIPFTLKILL